MESLRRELEESNRALRADLQEKHEQNRRDIHSIRNQQQSMVLQLAHLEGQVEPLIDNGQPGLITKLSGKIDEVVAAVRSVMLAQATEDGKRSANDWWRSLAAAIVVALIGALAAHFWK